MHPSRSFEKVNRPGSLIPPGGRVHPGLRGSGLATAAAAAGLLPALFLLVAGMLGRKAPGILASRTLVLGGLVWALVVSFRAVTHWGLSRAPGELRLHCTIRKRIADLVIFAASLVLLAIIGGQLAVESLESR